MGRKECPHELPVQSGCCCWNGCQHQSLQQDLTVPAGDAVATSAGVCRRCTESTWMSMRMYVRASLCKYMCVCMCGWMCCGMWVYVSVLCCVNMLWCVSMSMLWCVTEYMCVSDWKCTIGCVCLLWCLRVLVYVSVWIHYSMCGCMWVLRNVFVTAVVYECIMYGMLCSIVSWWLSPLRCRVILISVASWDVLKSVTMSLNLVLF